MTSLCTVSRGRKAECNAVDAVTMQPSESDFAGDEKPQPGEWQAPPGGTGLRRGREASSPGRREEGAARSRAVASL